MANYALRLVLNSAKLRLKSIRARSSSRL